MLAASIPPEDSCYALMSAPTVSLHQKDPSGLQVVTHFRIAFVALSLGVLILETFDVSRGCGFGSVSETWKRQHTQQANDELLDVLFSFSSSTKLKLKRCCTFLCRNDSTYKITMVSYGGNSTMLVRQQRCLRPQVHISRNEVEEAMELLSCGYKGEHRGYSSPKIVMQQRQSQSEDDDLALALALSQSMLTTAPKPVLQGTIAKIGSVEGIEERHGDAANATCSDEASVQPSSCANDFAIAVALNALDGASSCVADLESIHLGDDDTSCTRYDAGMILVGDDDDAEEDDDWSCVILEGSHPSGDKADR